MNATGIGPRDSLALLHLSLEQVLTDFGLLAAFYARPVFQQNDYLFWIDSAAQPEARDARIAALLDDLAEVGETADRRNP
jgi:hypothetical protein